VGYPNLQLTNSAGGEADIVDQQPVDPRLVRYVAQDDAAHCVGHSDRGYQVAGLRLADVQGLRVGGHIEIGHVEADARAEIGHGEDHEDHVLQQGEVHHLGESVAGLLGACDAAAALGLLLQGCKGLAQVVPRILKY